MYYSTNALTGYEATATDGDLGKVLGFGFDDRSWQVPYVIVRAGWIPGRVVMVDADKVTVVDGEKQRIYFDLTGAEMRAQADIHDRPPVHLVEEHARKQSEEATAEALLAQARGSSLRNSSEIVGYVVDALDGRAGKVTDLIVDTRSWSVHQLVLRRGWFHGQVFVPTHRIMNIESEGRRVALRVDREEAWQGRRFDEKALVNTTQETRVVDYRANTHLVAREEFVHTSSQ